MPSSRKPQHLPAVVIAFLRAILFLTFTDREIKVSRSIESDPPAEIRSRRTPRVGNKDLSNFFQRASLQSASRHRRRGEIPFHRL